MLFVDLVPPRAVIRVREGSCRAPFSLRVGTSVMPPRLHHTSCYGSKHREELNIRVSSRLPILLQMNVLTKLSDQPHAGWQVVQFSSPYSTEPSKKLKSATRSAGKQTWYPGIDPFLRCPLGWAR